MTERKRAAGESARLLSVLESSLNEIYIFDVDTLRFEYVNECARANLGYSMDAMRRMTPLDIKPDFAEAAFQTLIEPLRRHEKPKVVFETAHRRANGSLYPVEVHLQLVERGDKPVFLAVINDITERRLADKAVRDSEEQYRQLFENSLAGVFHTKPSGQIVSCNDAFVRMFGYESKEEMLSHSAVDTYLTPAHRERHMELLREKRKLTNFESEQRRKDGSLMWTLENVALIREADGTESIHGSVIDLTERRLAEVALRESNEKFQQLADNITDVFWIRSPDLRKLYYVSPAYERIFGRSVNSQHANPEEWVDYLHPDDRERVLSSFASLTGEESSLDIEYRIVRPDGEIRWVRTRGFPVRDAAQIVTRYVGILTDITASKRTERRLNIEYRVSRVLAESATLRQASSGILRTICESMNWEVGEFWNVDNRAGVMRFDDMWIAPDMRADKFLGVSRKTTFARGVGLPGRVWASGKPVWIPDVVVSAYFLRAAEAKKAGLHSAFSFPILSGNEVIGAIEFFGREIRQPDEELMSMFEALGPLLGQFFERKQADEAMRESEEKYRTILENIEDGYFEVDIAGNFTFFNDSLCGILGYPRDEMLGMNNRDFIDTRDFAKVYKTFNKVYRTGEPARAFDWEIIRKDGTRRYVEGSISRREDSTDQPIGFRGIVRDITERRGAEEQLRLHATALGAAANAIIITDRDGTIAWVNPAFTDLTGYTLDEVLGRNPRILKSGISDAAFYKTLWDTILSGRAWQGEMINRRKDGTTYSEEQTITPVMDEAGQITNFISVKQNITERRRAEAKILSEQLFSESIVNSLPGIFYLIDQTRKFLRWNENFEQITGYSAEEIATLSPLDLFAGEEKELIDQRIQEVFASGSADAEAHLVSKSGERTAHYFTGVRIYSDDQPCLMGVGLDITVRKQLEEQFRQSQKMEAVGVLAGGIAHDFNNLLTAINGYSDLTLRKMSPDEPLRRNIEEVKKAGDRAAELTSQLLAFSRKQVLKPVVHNLNSVIETIENMLRRIIRENIELRTVLDPKLGNIKADPGQIEQVIMNLVVNARDAMPDGGTLTIETQNVYLDHDYVSQKLAIEPGPFTRITVSDTGMGMDEITRQHIFEPFFTTKEVGKGTGLGLSMVYGIVKQSGGDITVYSEPGHGTTFKIYLPSVDEEVQKLKWNGDHPEKYLGTETILLVEDEEVVRNLAKEILTGNGYTVLEAENGKAALAICSSYEGHIDLLLTDVIMPRMSGSELKQTVVEMMPDIKVLFMSGYTDDSVANRGVFDADIPFIEKPFTPDALSRKVREVLEY